MADDTQDTIQETVDGETLENRIDDALQEELRAHKQNIEQGIAIVDSVDAVSENGVKLTFALAESGSFMKTYRTHGEQFGRLLADADATYTDINGLVGHAVDVEYSEDDGWDIRWDAVERQPLQQHVATVTEVRQAEGGVKARIRLRLGSGHELTITENTYGNRFGRLLAESDATYRTIDELVGLDVPVKYHRDEGWSVEWGRVTQRSVRPPSTSTYYWNLSREEKQWVDKRVVGTGCTFFLLSVSAGLMIGLSAWLAGGLLMLVGLILAGVLTYRSK